jgi:TatA/E family protein of Tat protein translocase
MNEWVIVAIVVLVVIFGVNKLPEIARNIGRSSSEFKKGVTEGGADFTTDADKPAETKTEDSKPAE